MTGSGTGSFTATIGNNTVTYGKIQAVTASAKLLGSSATGTAVTEITLGTNLSMTGSTLNATAGGGTVTSVGVSGAGLGVTNPTTTPVISQIAASSVSDGYMSSTYASKLDGIASGASVSSVAASGGTTGLSFTGGPITGAGTLTLNGTLNPDSGGTGHTAPTVNGQLLIGDAIDEVWDKATLTAGSGISITNGAGSITIAATGSGSGDVVGPASVAFNELARFKGVDPNEIEGSGWGTDNDNLYPVNAGTSSMTQGFVWIPMATGSPGTPGNASLRTGRAPLYFDSSSNELYAYNGSAWRKVLLT